MRDRQTGGLADWRRVREVFLAQLRRVAGMPDYSAYLDHLRSCHPDRPLPTRKQFYEEFIRARYCDGPTRCC